MAAPLHASIEYIDYFFTSESVNSRPFEWEVALHTSSPEGGNENEVSSPNYSRQDVTFSSSHGDKYYEAKNKQDVIFDAGGAGDNYAVTHYTIRDKTKDKALAMAKLAVPIPVNEGTKIIFPAQFIVVRGV